MWESMALPATPTSSRLWIFDAQLLLRRLKASRPDFPGGFFVPWPNRVFAQVVPPTTVDPR